MCWIVQHNSYNLEFKRRKKDTIYFLYIFSWNKEPIQSVAPRIEPTEKFKLAFVNVRHTTNLLCPVQSYPTPSYR